jgi:integrase
MSTIRFNLKDKQATRKTLIYLVLFVESSRIKISTGLSIPPKYWNENKQRSKELIEFSEYSIINNQLNFLEARMNTLLKKYHEQGYLPDTETIKSDFLDPKEIDFKRVGQQTLWDHFNVFVEEKRKLTSDVRDYDKALRKHLLQTEIRMGKMISFEMIANSHSQFADIWRNYLLYEALNSESEPGLSVNTVGKQNKNLKAFLNWVFDQNIYSKFSLKSFPTLTEEVDKVYLTEAELEKLENLVLEDPNEGIVRDLFLIGCETAFRFSDFTRIDRDAIRDNKIYFRPKKTESSANNLVIIPISQRLNRILEKYAYTPPRFDANKITLFNSTLRTICEKAEINSSIIQYKKRSGETTKTNKFKYEEVTSHTCRRTFCTLKFLKGMPAQAIMKFSGHKTERNFLRYLKLDAELTANKYEAFF